MINFLKFTKLYFLISLFVIVIGLWSTLSGGMRPSIDFTGGTLLEYRFETNIDSETAKTNAIKLVSEVDKVRSSKIEGKDMRFVMAPIDEKKEVEIRGALEKVVGSKPKVLRFEIVGATLGGELLKKTLIASFVATLGILLYVTYAFKKVNYGLAAVGAMLHDLLVLWGMYALVVKFTIAEIDALFVTALLTTLSFSVHDTIVVFDKIREFRRRGIGRDIKEQANRALTETMVRSINNSLTIILMLVILVLMGGESTRYFAVALLIGTIAGTYSSPFVATPLLVWLHNRKK